MECATFFYKCSWDHIFAAVQIMEVPLFLLENRGKVAHSIPYCRALIDVRSLRDMNKWEHLPARTLLYLVCYVESKIVVYSTVDNDR
jgi:hypothetical protein